MNRCLERVFRSTCHSGFAMLALSVAAMSACAPPVHVSRQEAAILGDPQGAITGDALPPYTVILTYDDGPDEHTLEIAQYLHDQNPPIHATFFVNGRRFCKTFDANGNCLETRACDNGDEQTPVTNPIYYPESLLDELVRLGHRIANHSQDHCQLSHQTSAQSLVWEIRATQDILDRHQTDGLALFRPPGMLWDAQAAAFSRTDAGLDKLIGPVAWDWSGSDWDCWENGMSVPECGQRYLSSLEDPLQGRPNRNGIVLMHDRPEFNVGEISPLLLTQWLVPTLQQRGYTFASFDDLSGLPIWPGFGPLTHWSYNDDFSDPQQWGSNVGYYGTIRLADVNGDGFADLCGRGAGGIVCALNRTNGQFAPAAVWLDSDLTDGSGWLPPQYSTSIQFGDINHDGKADLCGRGAGGIVCAVSDGRTSFGGLAKWSQGGDFSDAQGWASDPGYYGTIRLADVNGDGFADVCGRGAGGMVCGINQKNGQFASATVWLGSLTDQLGWRPAQYSTTIQLADINKDGKADLCGRGVGGIVCALSNGSQFGALTKWSVADDFSDARQWGSEVGYYGTIRLADVNGDGFADLCGRGYGGIVCALNSTLGSFSRMRTWFTTDLRDRDGWQNASYATTIQLADVTGDGQADVCGRGFGGIVCAPRDAAALDFGGAYGYFNGGQLSPNPATGTSSCPPGYNAQQVLGTYDLDWGVYFCFRPSQAGADPLLDFGGMWGYVQGTLVKNPVANAQGCPAGYTDQQVLGTYGVDWPLHVCWRSHTTGVAPAVKFGGMYGYINSGVPMPNPAIGESACPAGYTDTQVLGSNNVDWGVHFCWSTTTSWDFGGAFGMTAGSWVPNPVTGAATCPEGYDTQQILGTTNVDYPAYVCFRRHVDGVDPAIDFGGMYGYGRYGTYYNSVTGAASCPAGYTDQMILWTTGVDYGLHVCYQTHALGSPPVNRFGGAWGYVSGNFVPNPTTGGASCPFGYTAATALGTDGIDYAVGYCVALGTDG